MITRDNTTLDLMSFALSGVPFSVFVAKAIAGREKTNNGHVVKGMKWDGDISIGLDYKQIEAYMTVSSIPNYVDNNSHGSPKSTEGAAVHIGSIVKAKHRFVVSENQVREQLALAADFGRLRESDKKKMWGILFTNIQNLIEGNYNGLTLQRDQLVSLGRFTLNDTTNPYGLRETFKANIRESNQIKLTGANAWYDASGNAVTTADPVANLLDMSRFMRWTRGYDRMGYHFEADELTLDKTLSHPNVVKKLAASIYPNSSLSPNDLMNGLSREAQTQALSRLIEGEIDVINNVVKVEDKGFVRTFAQDVWVVMPNSDIGTVKAARPLAVAKGVIQDVFVDGGRTLIKQYDEHQNNNIIIESEQIALPVISTLGDIVQLFTTEKAFDGEMSTNIANPLDKYRSGNAGGAIAPLSPNLSKTDEFDIDLSVSRLKPFVDAEEDIEVLEGWLELENAKDEPRISAVKLLQGRIDGLSN